jgi:hypothetical protein
MLNKHNIANVYEKEEVLDMTIIRYEYFDTVVSQWAGIYSLCFILYEKHYKSVIPVPAEVYQNKKFWFTKAGERKAKKELKLMINCAKRAEFPVRRLVETVNVGDVIILDEYQVVKEGK